jgi:hypothetical protein
MQLRPKPRNNMEKGPLPVSAAGLFIGELLSLT